MRAARIAICVACAVACGEPDRSPSVAAPEATDARARPPQPPPEATARGWVGVIAARDAADIAAEVAGRVTRVPVRIGDTVEVGAVVASLEPRPLRDALEVALASQRAARAALDAAEVAVAEAERALAREQALDATGTTSKSKLEAAEFGRDKARADRERAAADLAESTARASQQRVRLSRAQIAAPFAGVVSVRYLDPGALVSVGTPIVRLIAAGELWVVFAVPSEHARSLAPNDTVRVHVEPIDLTTTATIQHIAPELEPASQMIVVEAALAPDATSAALKAGQAARVFPR